MIEQKHLGKINTDSADRDLEPTDIKDALNLVPQIEGKSNSSRRTSLSGMEKKVNGVWGTTFALPSGTNTTVGQFEDKSKSRVYFFNHNSNNSHGVYVYIPSENTIATIIESSTLNFTNTTVIAGAGIVDETLVFTDGTNQIRSIHVQTALNTSNDNAPKTTTSVGLINGREWALVFDCKNIIRVSVSLTLTKVDGTVITINLTPIDTVSDIDVMLDAWVEEINSTVFEDIAERCGDSIKIIENPIRVSQIATIVPSRPDVLGIAPTNFFESWTERNINLINQPPLCEPTYSVKDDLDVGLNFINAQPFQFRSRNVYYDNTISTLSPISGVAFSKNCEDSSPNLRNYIEVRYHEDNYTSFEMSLIKDVEIFFRIGNDGNWRKIESLSREEYFTGKFDFYNDGNYTVVGDIDSAKLFDSIPDKSNSLTILKNRLFIGGITEGRETPCVEADLSVTIDETPEEPATWTIEGYLRVVNTWNWDGTITNNFNNLRSGINNQVIWKDGNTPQFGGISHGWTIRDNLRKVGDRYKQYIPKGGFTVFLAGTNYKATTKQVWSRNGSSLNDLEGEPVVYTYNAGEIRDLMEEDKCYQKFSITGVKPGRYILRVASHLVYDTDLPPADIAEYVGPTYQINNTNLWQETSTHLRIINEPIIGSGEHKSVLLGEEKNEFKYPKGDQELVLELGIEGGIYDISTETNSVMLIDDLCHPNEIYAPGIKAGAFDAYIIDTGGGLTGSTDFSKGSVIPNCDVRVRDRASSPFLDPINYDFTSPIFKADHNGYFYNSRHYQPPPPLTGESVDHRRQVEITSSGRKVCDFGDFSNSKGKNILFKKDVVSGWSLADTGYNIGDVKTGACGNSAPKSYALSWYLSPPDPTDGERTKQVIIFADDSNIRELGRTQIEGDLVDVNGVPISNALITLTGTNETRTTDSEGHFSITTYAQTSPDDVKVGQLFYNTSLSACLQESDPLGSDKVEAISISIDGANYNNLKTNPNWYDLGLKTFGTTKDLSKSTFLKRGGIYQWGVVYYDDSLRSSLVSTQEDLKVKFPFYTEDLHDFYPDTYASGTFRYGDPKVNWELNSLPPSWATRYKWVRTKNSAYNTYLHWVAYKIIYARSYDLEWVEGGGQPTEIDPTTYSDGDAKEIYISIENILKYKGVVANSEVGYTWQKGDRVVLIKNDNTYYTTYYDLEVKAQRGNFIVIEAVTSFGELKEGLEIHVYTPKLQVEDDVYYEISGCYPIVNGFHTGQSQDQTSSVPAKGTFSTGDTYKLSRTIPANTGEITGIFDSEHISDSTITRDSDIGRPNIVNNYFKQEYRFGTVRFSNPYVQGSFVDGIKTFDALDEEVLPYERGIIRKMVGTTNTILTIHETETTSLYITESFLHTAEGSDVLTKVDKVIGDEKLLKGEFGTRNPESVVEYDDSIYWWDENKAEPIRYSNNGLTPLAYNLGVKKLFMDTEDVRKAYRVANPNSNSKVYGGYDPVRNLFMVTFADLGDGNTDTIAFHEDSKYWVTRLSFIPQHFTKLSNTLFSFNNGELWQHDIDSNNPNTFYGVHYNSEFTIVSNVNPSNEKIYRNIGISTNNKWNVTEISNREGQLSSLVKGSFIQRDNVYYADILRDENTNTDQLSGNQTPRLHGHVMRSQVMEFKFVTDETGKLYVEEVFVGLQSSPGHLIDNSQ